MHCNSSLACKEVIKFLAKVKATIHYSSAGKVFDSLPRNDAVP
jgi:hypothetical protein